MKYIYYNNDLNEISNAPTIDFNIKNLHQDAIIQQLDTYHAPIGYRIVGLKKTQNTGFVEVEPACYSIKAFKDNAEIIKAKDSFYYRQWLLACSLYDTPFDFSARAKAFLR